MFSAIAPLSLWMAMGLSALKVPRLPRYTLLAIGVSWFALVGIVLAPITINQMYTPCNSGSDSGTVCAFNSNGAQFWQNYSATFHEPDRPEASLSAKLDSLHLLVTTE